MADKDLLQTVDPYIQAENTGTAMVVFTDNSLARIYLNSGIPTSARYKNKEGMEALEMCKNMDVKSVKFHTNTDVVRSRKLLDSNDDVIKTLNHSDKTESAYSNAHIPASSSMLTSSNRRRLGSLLSDYIGPVAPLVMTDLPRRVDVESALSIVSREIDDTGRAAEFVAIARQMLE